MAARADRPLAEPAQVEAVGLMAIRARRLLRVKGSLRASLFVALRAPKGNLGDALGVRFVTRDAVTLVLDRMRRGHFVVTPFAGSVTCCSHGVRFVATIAVAMLRGLVLRQDLRPLVARRAPKRTRCGKRVRFVTGCARIMPIAERRGCRHNRLLCLVAFHAGRRFRGELVPPMAICASAAQA